MKMYDPVHGFIHFNDLESILIDTEVFQRLRYIHQLGISFLVYPGATHTRFEHSLGAMHLASQIFDQIGQDENRDYFRQMVRFAALCHDLGHLPFSHVAESRLLPGGHEEWTLKIIESPQLAPVWEKIATIFPGMPVMEHVIKFALGEETLLSLRPETMFSSWERIYSQIVTADFFGSDRIDYLLRDARATGLSYGLFDYMQLIQMLIVTPDEKGTLTLGVEENGVASCEALLLGRHFMQRRVYQYASARAYSFHMARFMEILYGDPRYLESVENYLSMNEPEVLCALEKARKDPNHPGHIDALCLFDRKKRFQAITLPSKIGLQDLESFKEKSNISDHEIHWDFAKKQPEIVSAGQYSEIAIPPTKKNWLYLAPEYAFKL
ncbi:MAG: Deoxyguanosinetriphosphate triphosphohydrolase-like protein [Chlamydiae bacterium]|nr:Deoxyguanosinetriphosphate triphosphohydrolase-like protein [Chlamydiota bacterium]